MRVLFPDGQGIPEYYYSRLTGGENKLAIVTMKELLEAGKVVPVIDRRYPLNEVPEAIRYLEGRHARGKVVITVA